MCSPSKPGVDIRAQRVDVVHHQVPQPRPLRQQARQHAVAQQVRHLVPVTDRMQALQRQIVGVVAAFAGLPRPADQRGVQALAHLLRLLVEQLLRHLLPGETQVAHHGHHPQPDGAARRQQQRPGIAVVRSARSQPSIGSCVR